MKMPGTHRGHTERGEAQRFLELYALAGTLDAPTLQVLARAGVTDPECLRRVTEAELRELDGIGPRRAEAIRQALGVGSTSMADKPQLRRNPMPMKPPPEFGIPETRRPGAGASPQPDPEHPASGLRDFREARRRHEAEALAFRLGAGDYNCRHFKLCAGPTSPAPALR
jgi:hypothetical protein